MARDSELWEMFLDVRHQLICEWTARGRQPTEIARLLSMDSVQVEGISMYVEQQRDLEERKRWLERELGVVRSRVAKVN